MRPRTIAVHAGGGPKVPGAPVSPSITTSTSFHAAANAAFSAASLDAGHHDGAPHFYTRWSNPTIAALEQRIAALEGGGGAVCFASGMAAIAGLFLTKLRAGDHLVVANVCYAGTAELAHDLLPGLGIAVTAVDVADVAAVARAVRPTTKLIHTETPANPILRVCDIAALAQLAHAAGAELSVDSTIATPIATQPLSLFADYVVHSATKYLCGHGDALGGVVVTDAMRALDLRARALVHLGGVLSPFAAWTILRGLETLPLRMAAHEAGARRVATFLAAHPKVAVVNWPGLPSHPGHDVARRQMRNFSGLLSFSTKDGARLATERLQTFSYAVSLGKAKSLLFYIPTNDLLRTSFHLSGADEAAYRARAGDGVYRVSVGLEDEEDLVEDLERALG